MLAANLTAFMVDPTVPVSRRCRSSRSRQDRCCGSAGYRQCRRRCGHAVQFALLERLPRATWTLYMGRPLQSHLACSVFS